MSFIVSSLYSLLFNKGNLGHDDVIKWKHFPRYWPFVWGIHQWLVNSPHKGQWCGAVMFSFICAWINGWVNNRAADDFRCHHAHYDVIIMDMIAACQNGCTLHLIALTISKDFPWSGGHLKNAYWLINLGALKFSTLYQNYIFQCMGKIFRMKFQRYLQNMLPIQWKKCSLLKIEDLGAPRSTSSKAFLEHPAGFHKSCKFCRNQWRNSWNIENPKFQPFFSHQKPKFNWIISEESPDQCT